MAELSKRETLRALFRGQVRDVVAACIAMSKHIGELSTRAETWGVDYPGLVSYGQVNVLISRIHKTRRKLTSVLDAAKDTNQRLLGSEPDPEPEV